MVAFIESRQITLQKEMFCITKRLNTETSLDYCQRTGIPVQRYLLPLTITFKIIKLTGFQDIYRQCSLYCGRQEMVPSPCEYSLLPRSSPFEGWLYLLVSNCEQSRWIKYQYCLLCCGSIQFPRSWSSDFFCWHWNWKCFLWFTSEYTELWKRSS